VERYRAGHGLKFEGLSKFSTVLLNKRFLPRLLISMVPSVSGLTAGNLLPGG
jgi:hypothetical protein